VNWTLGAEVEALVLAGRAKTGTGNALDNSITGTGGKNTLVGDAGNDTLDGGDGADLLDGGAGIDSLIGGLGNDTYIVDDPADVIVELPGGGTDEVRASFSYTLGAELEDLSLLTGATDGTGNGLNNEISGNNANNLLTGLGGKDVLFGGGGDDTLLGGDGGDTLEGGGGRDSMDGGLNGDVFRWMLTAHGRDIISGYNPAQDDLHFSAAGFGGGLVAGVPLAAGQFEANGTGAATAVSRFVYNTSTGVLNFDADGTGAAQPTVTIATFLGLPALTAADIIIIA
jgi:Ca2+-binding RTX toxin-like protein